LIKKVCLIP